MTSAPRIVNYPLRGITFLKQASTRTQQLQHLLSGRILPNNSTSKTLKSLLGYLTDQTSPIVLSSERIEQRKYLKFLDDILKKLRSYTAFRDEKQNGSQSISQRQGFLHILIMQDWTRKKDTRLKKHSQKNRLILMSLPSRLVLALTVQTYG